MPCLLELKSLTYDIILIYFCLGEMASYLWSTYGWRDPFSKTHPLRRHCE